VSSDRAQGEPSVLLAFAGSAAAWLRNSGPVKEGHLEKTGFAGQQLKRRRFFPVIFWSKKAGYFVHFASLIFVLWENKADAAGWLATPQCNFLGSRVIIN
jgi:hypothetical protein